jgi:SPP1 family predicted phage head-tail adaptor
MRAGKLDRKILVERSTETVDDFGTVTHQWMTLYPLRAELIEQSAQEFMRNYGASSETTVIFRTRFVLGVTVADRVTYDGREYDIKEVKEIGRRRGLELRCVVIGL